MNNIGKCRFYEWDETDFALPDEYILDSSSTLSDALNVFYSAGGYDFFNVADSRLYADGWLDFIGSLYRDIAAEKFTCSGKPFVVPLTDEQRKELFARGVPAVFVSDIK